MSSAVTTLRRDSRADDGAGPRLGLLGGFDLRQGDRQIGLPLSAQRLVAFLALRHRVLQRVFVAGTLWLDSSQDAANASLRTVLWRLRRLGCHLVDATATHLALSGSIAVDVHEVAAAAARVTDEGSIGGHGADRDVLVVADDLLPDWYDDWVVLDRERFRQIRLHALETLCETLSRRGRYGDAVDAGLRAVACEPLRESAHRAVVRAHLVNGNHNDALRQYELFRRMLDDQLGLAPSRLMHDLLDEGRVAEVVTVQ